MNLKQYDIILNDLFDNLKPDRYKLTWSQLDKLVFHSSNLVDRSINIRD